MLRFYPFCKRLSFPFMGLKLPFFNRIDCESYKMCANFFYINEN